MHRLGKSPRRCSLLAFAVFLSAVAPCCAEDAATAKPRVAQQLGPLSLDDVSWLFPPPKTVKDLENTIAIADLTSPDPFDSTRREPILPDEVFKKFIDTVESDKTKINEHRVFLPADAHDIKVWRVAGLRIDPGAPGLSNAVMKEFGQIPQLRFILQPVTVHSDGFVEVHDVAAHVIYNFSQEGLKSLGWLPPIGCFPKGRPDMEAFRGLARDFRMLRDQLGAGQFGGQAIATNGALLGVHPGLASASAKPLRDALVKVLEKHLGAERLSGLAIMALADHAPQPWVFMATGLFPVFGLRALPAPTLDGRQFAEALAVNDESHQVVPTPATNNLNPITCKNAAVPFGGLVLPPAKRKGVSTAELFELGDKPVTDLKTAARVRKIVDIIADPTRSHFFNTDCVSCHTDTRRTLDLLPGSKIPGVDPTALPGSKWNVRNFGWSLSKEAEKPGDKAATSAATATRRAASETQAVVDYINSHGLAR